MKNDVTKLELWKARIKNFLRGDFLRSKKLTPTMQMIVSVAQRYDANGICFVARNVYNIKNRFGRDLSFLRRFKVIPFLILGDEYDNMVTVFYAIDINSEDIIDKIRKAYNKSKCVFFICKNEDEYKMILQKLHSEGMKVLFDGNGEGGECIIICDKIVSESINNRLSKIATSLNAPCNDDGGLKNESLLIKDERAVCNKGGDCHVVPPRNDDGGLKNKSLLIKNEKAVCNDDGCKEKIPGQCGEIGGGARNDKGELKNEERIIKNNAKIPAYAPYQTVQGYAGMTEKQNDKKIPGQCGEIGGGARNDKYNEEDGTMCEYEKYSDLKIQAIVTCYNEEDIIEHTIKYLVEQGIYVHIVDNWSTDGSWDIVQKYVQRSRFVTSEKFPADGPSETYDWGNILCRVQEIAMNNSADFDWFVHHDADEVREAPFESIVHLRDGIIIADRCGFNAIDYTVINFVPIPDSYNGTQDIAQYLRYCSFGNQYGDIKQVKTWKSCDNINLVDSSGHHVQFIGKEQKIFPYKFLLRHYSLRSKEQAQRKIFKDRKPRWNKQELKKQWHTHYNKINNSHDLKWNKENYLFFEREIFYKTYMMQMITGAGVQIEEVKRNK